MAPAANMAGWLVGAVESVQTQRERCNLLKPTYRV